MKKKFLVGIIGICLLLGIVLGVYLAKNHAGKSNPQSQNESASIKRVDEVVRVPHLYIGFLGVEGTVIEIDESKSIFLLGCEDACGFMPVEYKGQMPEVKSQIIVYGELKKQEDERFIFQAKEVKRK